MNTLGNLQAYQNRICEKFNVADECDIECTHKELGEKYAYVLDFTEDLNVEVNHAVFVDGVIIEFNALHPDIWEEVNV